MQSRQKGRIAGTVWFTSYVEARAYSWVGCGQGRILKGGDMSKRDRAKARDEKRRQAAEALASLVASAHALRRRYPAMPMHEAVARIQAGIDAEEAMREAQT
jgi:hypothetical protein